MEIGGYLGKILRVDLSKRRMSVTEEIMKQRKGVLL